MNIEAFFSLSYGLYIVSAHAKGRKNGYVANTAFQVTATPPQLAISCNKDNFSAGIIQESGFFSLSVLEKNASKEIINLFGYKSGKSEQKFNKIKHFDTSNGTPVVTEDCVAWFECKVVKTLDVGTHILFVGEVLDGNLMDEEKEPITYAHYRKERHGLSPKNAPTYIDHSLLEKKYEKPVEKEAAPMRKWVCRVCGHVYDPKEGDPDSGIAPGTSFEDLPDDWVCPDCGAEKADFQPVDDKEGQKKEKSAAVGKELKKWKCEVCGHIYDPKEGDPDAGIAPGTAFEDIPDDWYCPICGVGKEDFAPLD